MTRPRHYARYPWGDWIKMAKKGPVTLRRGKDFKCEPYIMAQQVRNLALRKNYPLTADVVRTTVTLYYKGRGKKAS